MIKISNLNKFFNRGLQNEIHVLNDVTVQLPEKGMVAIFGKSGCGKTTLLNVIGGLDSFSGGAVTVDGESIRKNPDVVRNKYMGYIFQNYNLNNSESCFDNVADALRICGMKDNGEIEKRVISALKNVGMERYKSRTPDTLSGGQQQRIAIARAIVKNPKIILADEPTGNLDEVNTVMIMDLLKEISKDHLVILVTHEANLVDFYCDRVIELSDGKIISTKENENADGFTARDKNAIYLGELERSECKGNGASFEYYGAPAENPVKIRIVNHGGKIYLSVDTPGVHVLDSTSEIKFKEGVYEEKKNENSSASHIDMSELPPVHGSNFGRLFSLKSSVVSGYAANFKKNKKGKKLLKMCMATFAVVTVIMTAVFGTVFEDIIEIQNAYNHNVFYVYSADHGVSEQIYKEAYENGADFIRLQQNGTVDGRVRLQTNFFETFSSYQMPTVSTNAVYLGITAADGYETVCGKTEGITNDEMVITTAVADRIIEQSGVGYIEDYDDVLGLISSSFAISGTNVRVVGVVESNETAIYLSELAMAKYVLSMTSLAVSPASDSKLTVKDGEASVFEGVSYLPDGVEYPKVGETFKLHGYDFTLTQSTKMYAGYEEYLNDKSIKKLTCDEYIKQKAEENGEGEYDTLRFEWFDYYYSEFDDFIKQANMFDEWNVTLWLYREKGIEEAKYLYLQNDDYYKAYEFKKENGRYPTESEFNEHYNSLPDLKNVMSEYEMMYSNEFYSSMSTRTQTKAFVVSDNDYIKLSKRVGETHKSAMTENYGYKDDYVVDMDISISYSSVYISDDIYTAIHSDNVELTEKWIKEQFSNVETPNEYTKPIVTPDDVADNIMKDNHTAIVAGIVTICVILVILCVCMYFIMRSALMSRIKEIGIYRAIGVSKKNITFRFFIETCVLALFTVFVGYLGASVFIWVCMGMSSLVSDVFFYPLWLALADFMILAVLCITCGLLPVTLLLSKTPSQILAKYDV